MSPIGLTNKRVWLLIHTVISLTSVLDKAVCEVDCEDEANRANGGFRMNAADQPAVGTIWQRWPIRYPPVIRLPINLPPDGFLKGHDIALKKNHVVMMKEVGNEIIKSGPGRGLEGPVSIWSWAQHPGPNKFDVYEGPQKVGIFDRSDPEFVMDLGYSPFALYKHKMDDGPFLLPPWEQVPYEDGDIKKFPKWETDPNRPPMDSNFYCYIHVWSMYAHDRSRKRHNNRLLNPGDSTERPGLRERVRIQVEKESCKGDGWCVLRTVYSGQICTGGGDRGAPVLCGGEEKLTWLVVPPTQSQCWETVDAYHVAFLIPYIDKYDVTLIDS